MNWTTKLTGLLAVAAVVMAGSVRAMEFELVTPKGPIVGTLGPDLVSGTWRPIRYGFAAGAPVVQVRADVPVICRAGPVPVSGKRIVVDPNGYFQDTSMQYMLPGDAPQGVDTPFAGWVRASDNLRFTTASFVSGGQAPLFFVSGVDAQCVVLPASDTTPGSAGACTDATDAPDSVFNGEFEAPSGDGTLALSSRVVSNTGGWLTYEHVLTAQEGPISALSLREQFAHAGLDTGQPVFRHSMLLASSWNCQASEGASCGANERMGLGYIRLDGVNLNAGSCLKITATRPRRSDGVADVPFSGRVFTAAFYKHAVNLQYVDAPPATTRINYVQ